MCRDLRRDLLMLKCVIFDLDGTTGNTLPFAIEAFRVLVKEVSGRVLTDPEITSTFGASEEKTIRALLPEISVEEGMDLYMKKYEELHSQCPAPFDGIVETIGMIKSRGVLCALVTGKSSRSLGISLKAFGMEDTFDEIETGSPLGLNKKAGIGKILEKHGISPKDTLYIGDAPTDITEARAASCRIASAAWAQTTDVEALKKLSPDMIFFSVQELKNYLRENL
jgi:phosphoglycolate phosphatase/pyrophosphatase PpaX